MRRNRAQQGLRRRQSWAMKEWQTKAGEATSEREPFGSALLRNKAPCLSQERKGIEKSLGEEK
jgi:hypothetical protein